MRYLNLNDIKNCPVEEDSAIRLEENSAKIVRLTCFARPEKQTAAAKLMNVLKLNTIMECCKTEYYCGLVISKECKTVSGQVSFIVLGSW